MQKRTTALVAALTLAGLGALAACTGARTGSGGEKPPEQYAPAQEAAALRAPMAEAVRALADVKRLAAMGGAAERQQAYQRFATAFGQVLGPLSFQDSGAAQRMANANTALEEALARPNPDRAAVAAEADVILRTMSETAARLGTPLMATATAQVGADQVAPPVPTGAGPGTTPAAAGGGPATVPAAKAPRVIEVIARNYRFEPARIEVRKGEPITIRLRNMGTEKHEWELEAFHVEIRPIDPGKTGQVTFTPDRTGTFQYVCEVDGHKQKGMIGYFIVK